MLRIVTQILIGLMLVFGSLTLAPRALFYIRKRDLVKAIYFLLLVSITFFFALMAFYFAYAGIKEFLG
jgi:hypothetical protein